MKGLLSILLGLGALTLAQGAELVSARLVGKATDPAGQPVAGATVLLNRSTGARLEDFPAKATTGPDGRYELTLRFFAGATLTVREVFAEAPGRARTAAAVGLQFKGGETTTLSFVSPPGEVLAGVVNAPLTDRERASRRQQTKTQRLFELSGPAVSHLELNARCYYTEPGGRFEIFVPPGEYTLRLHGYDAGPAEWQGIKSGRRDLVLTPPAFEWSEVTLGPRFDELWKEMDRHYSYFFLKPEVDWPEFKTRHRPAAVRAKNATEFVTALRFMLAPLRDLHVNIETPEGIQPTHNASWHYNGNLPVTLAQLENRVDCGKFATVGRVKAGGFGCLVMLRQSEANHADVQQAVAAIQNLGDAPGFIVDLRRANGGNEALAVDIAQWFCAQDTVYAKSKFRAGPRHTDFTKEFERLIPRTPAPFTKPVVCLTGPGAVSSGEAFVKMLKALPQVTTVGQRTRGASGNPKPWLIPNTGVSVHFSRWVDLMPDGTTFEGAGIPPDVEVNAPADAYATADPTWEKGLEILREKVVSPRK